MILGPNFPRLKTDTAPPDPRLKRAGEALVAARHALERAGRGLRDAADFTSHQPGAAAAFLAEARAANLAADLLDHELAKLGG